MQQLCNIFFHIKCIDSVPRTHNRVTRTDKINESLYLVTVKIRVNLSIIYDKLCHPSLLKFKEINTKTNDMRFFQQTGNLLQTLHQQQFTDSDTLTKYYLSLWQPRNLEVYPCIEITHKRFHF